MLLLDLDRYYTPSHLARTVIESSNFGNARRCFDSACGDGNLLEAARQMIPNIRCYGVDADLNAIARLRSRNPDWVLSSGDSLSAATWKRAKAIRESVECDLALLNPPFSMQARKGILVSITKFQGRCSVAMAHIMMVASRTRPKVCAAVVPESLLYSNLDALARAWLSRTYVLSPVAEVTNTTFNGARANAAIITLKRRVSPLDVQVDNQFSPRQPIAGVVRGGLPLFQAVPTKRGVHLVHSTDLDSLLAGQAIRTNRVRPIARGLVSGHVILLPRVGVPRPSHLTAIELHEQVQLSDCVVALTFHSREEAYRAERILQSHWMELLGLYRGTGARYITLQRLTSWLQMHTII